MRWDGSFTLTFNLAQVSRHWRLSNQSLDFISPIQPHASLSLHFCLWFPFLSHNEISFSVDKYTNKYINTHTHTHKYVYTYIRKLQGRHNEDENIKGVSLGGILWNNDFPCSPLDIHCDMKSGMNLRYRVSRYKCLKTQLSVQTSAGFTKLTKMIQACSKQLESYYVLRMKCSWLK